MGGTAILDDAQPAGGDLVIHPVIQEDDAVADILLQTVACEGLFALLAGDDSRDALVLEPEEEPSQFGAHDGLIRQAGKERFKAIKHNALGSNAVNRRAEADEQALQIVFASLLDLTALDADVVHNHFLVTDERGQVKAERGDVIGEFLASFLESHEDAWLVELARAAHNKFGGQKGFAAAGRATNERRPTLWQAAIGDFVKAANASGAFRNACEFFCRRLRLHSSLF